MQHEWVGVSAQFCDNERNALGHQTGNECDIAGEPIELGHQDGAFGGARGSQCCGKLWPPIERVGPLAGFGLDELPDGCPPPYPA